MMRLLKSTEPFRAGVIEKQHTVASRSWRWPSDYSQWGRWDPAPRPHGLKEQDSVSTSDEPETEPPPCLHQKQQSMNTLC